MDKREEHGDEVMPITWRVGVKVRIEIPPESPRAGA